MAKGRYSSHSPQEVCQGNACQGRTLASSAQPPCLGEAELVQLITPTINTDLTPSSPEQTLRTLGLQAAFPGAENKYRAISLQDLL